MVSTRTTSNAVNQEGQDRQNPAPLPPPNQDAAGHSEPSGPVTRQELQLLLQELTQSRRQLEEQLRANAELINKLDRQKRKRSMSDRASRSSSESSSSSDYHNRPPRPRLDGSRMPPARNQPTLTVGQIRVGPSTSFQTGPSSRGCRSSPRR